MGHNSTSTECKGFYSPRFDLSEAQVDILLTLHICILVVNIIANVLVILSLIRTKQLQNTSLRLILILSVSDILQAAVTQTLVVAFLYTYRSEENCNFHRVVIFFDTLFPRTSAYTIVLIAFDRYARVKYLTHYPVIVTPRRLHIAAAAVLSVPFIQSTLLTLGGLYDFVDESLATLFSIDTIAIIAGTSCYLLAILKMHKYRKEAQNQELLQHINSSLSRLASLILLSITIYYIPYVALAIVDIAIGTTLHGSVNRWFQFFFLLSNVFTFCNAFTNALLFIYVNKKTRSFLLHFFTCGKRAVKTFSGSEPDTKGPVNVLHHREIGKS